MLGLSAQSQAILSDMEANAKAETVRLLAAVEERVAPCPADAYAAGLARSWLALARHLADGGHWFGALDLVKTASRHATTARRRFDQGLADRGRKGWA